MQYQGGKGRTGWEPIWTRQKRVTLPAGDNLRLATECLFTRGR